MRLKHGSRVHNVVRRSEGLLEVDGVGLRASASPVEARRFDGRAEGMRTSVFVARQADRIFAQVGNRSYVLSVVARSAEAASESNAAGGLEAPMPGRVSRVEVGEGVRVTRGQELIVIEAMKMENALVAPWDGIVKSIHVSVGDMVTPGPPLVVIEALP